MKTLQNQYNLIKEGKGDKNYFLKTARLQFPQYVNQYSSFESATKTLLNKSIISEVKKIKTINSDPFSEFNKFVNEVKEPKEPTKEVTDMETKNYDYKNSDNIDNLYGQAFLTGYYTEIRDPKNHEKTVDEIKKIVTKNLAKNSLYYVENGQFGIKDLGYKKQDEPKEPKGKYKSSGYGNLPKEKLNENKLKENNSEKKTITLYKVESLSSKDETVLTDKTGNKMYIYKYEDPFNDDGKWVLYDAEEKKGKLVPTTSHRMSKIKVNILPFKDTLKENEDEIDIDEKREIVINTIKKLNPNEFKILLKKAGDNEEFWNNDEYGIDGINNIEEREEIIDMAFEEEDIDRYYNIIKNDLNETSLPSPSPLSITGEYEGKPVVFEGNTLEDLLFKGLNLSNSEDDFINKITYAITDTTSELSEEDQEKLRNYYNSKLNENSLEESHKDNYSLYLGHDLIYKSLPLERLYSILHSLQYELEEDLEDFMVDKVDGSMEPTTADRFSRKFDLSSVEPFDNLSSLENKIDNIIQEAHPFKSFKEGLENILKFKNISKGDTFTASEDFGIFKTGDKVNIDNVKNMSGEIVLVLSNELGKIDTIMGDLNDEVEVFTDSVNENSGEEKYKRKLLPNKKKGVADTIEIQSALIKIMRQVWDEKDLDTAKNIIYNFLETSKINDSSKQTIINNVKPIQKKSLLDQYLSNSFLAYEKMRVRENSLNESRGLSLEDAKAEAKRISQEEGGVAQHVNDNGDGTYDVSDWYDSDSTVFSVGMGIDENKISLFKESLYNKINKIINKNIK
jgi:hypothetical protein